MASQNEKAVIPSLLISQKIYFFRGSRVMLDAGWARRERT